MESPTEKRARKLGSGPRRKRDTSEASAQARAFQGRRRRIPKEVAAEIKAFQDKLDEIKRYEDKLRLVEVMRATAMAPVKAAEERVVKARQELAQAERALAGISSPDLMDVETREVNITMAIGRLKEEAAAMMERFQKPVDSGEVSR